ncbi:zinc dependent phospholipase C family protein [Lachnospiraceae bacterium ZAX-1]
MPGFTTHYLFGLNTYKTLQKDALKKTICKNHAAYSLGLQGSDIFFYFLPTYLVHKSNPGSVAHVKNTNKFLHYLIESRKLFPDKKEEKIAQAYILGFIGHYLLDCSCHPYIYSRTNYIGRKPNYYGNHITLETDIDSSLLSLYKHKKPSSFRQESTIVLTRLQLRTIATILYYVFSKTYPGLKIHYTTIRMAIRSIQLGTRLLRDPLGKKKVLIRAAEGIAVGYPVLSPMIASDSLRFFIDPLNMHHHPWHNPFFDMDAYDESFLDLIGSAQNDYVAMLRSLYQLFCSKVHTPIEKSRHRKILAALGNKSYHSGLDSSIPS